MSPLAPVGTVIVVPAGRSPLAFVTINLFELSSTAGQVTGGVMTEVKQTLYCVDGTSPLPVTKITVPTGPELLLREMTGVVAKDIGTKLTSSGKNMTPISNTARTETRPILVTYMDLSSLSPRFGDHI